MSDLPKVVSLSAREILDSRGFPTVEVDLKLEGEKAVQARAAVPSGASTGEGEALELRDGDQKRYHGKGVQIAIKNIEEKIAPTLIGKSFARITLLDDLLKELDGTQNKSKLGANTLLAISMAFCRAQALYEEIPLYQCIAHTYGSKGITLPVPLMNILNGGQHADNQLDIQEFMIVPVGFDRFSQALRAGSEVFHALKKGLQSKKLSTSVGDEGDLLLFLKESVRMSKLWIVSYKRFQMRAIKQEKKFT